jgi:hypothetical protein
MHEAGERQQRLVRRDVRRCLLAPDVLLARLQGQDIAALAVQVGRLADDPAGLGPDEFRRVAPQVSCRLLHSRFRPNEKQDWPDMNDYARAKTDLVEQIIASALQDVAKVV